MFRKAIICLFAFSLFLCLPRPILCNPDTSKPQDTEETPADGREEGSDRVSPQKTVSPPPVAGPDIVVTEFGLSEDLELYVVLFNAGDTDLRKEATLRTRIVVNDRRVSEFEHLTSKVLTAKRGNRYTLHPPYRVEIGGISTVKVSIWPKVASDDMDLGNNTLERSLVVYPFVIEPRAKQEFPISVELSRAKGRDPVEKIKAEARWEGEGFPLRLSLRGPEPSTDDTSVSGRSPLRMEVPILFPHERKAGQWTVSVTNLLKRKVTGHLILQHP